MGDIALGHKRCITFWHPFYPLNINPGQWYNILVTSDNGEALLSPWLQRHKSFMVSDNAVIKEKGQKDGTKKKLGKKETKKKT